MKIVKNLKSIVLLTTFALSLNACSTDPEPTPISYATTEFTWEKLLDEGGVYVMDANSTSYLEANSSIFSNTNGLSTEFTKDPTTVSTMTFKEDSTTSTGYSFELQIVRSGVEEYYNFSEVSITESNDLEVTTVITNPSNDVHGNKSFDEGETYTLVGKIVKDEVAGKTYIALEGSQVHGALNKNAIVGNELFMRNSQ